MEPVSLSQVAALAKVSKVTVSLALRDSPRISILQRKRIRKIADRLGYRPDPERAHLMARLRSKAGRSYQGNIAFVFHSKIEFYHGKKFKEAIQAQSARHGFVCNEIPFNPNDTCKKLTRILKSRGIQGVVLCMMWGVNLDQSFHPLFEQFTCVVVGSIPKKPALHAADADHYRTIRLAFGQALLHGYKRPGLICARELEIRRENRSSAAFLAEQHTLPSENRIPILWDITSGHRAFFHWFETYKPDCILCETNEEINLSSKPNFGIPGKVGLISLNWRTEQTFCAGVDLCYEEVGSAAVDLLVQCLNMDDKGIPEHPRIVLVQPRWQAGFSLPQLSVPKVGSAKNKPEAKSVSKDLFEKSGFDPLELTTFTNKSRNEFNTNHDRSQVMQLLHFPPGKRTIHNVPFDIIDEESNGGKSLIALHDMPDYQVKARSLSITVPIQKRVKTVWILHGCLWTMSMKHACSYLIHYVDGTTVTVPIIALDRANPATIHRTLGVRANIQDWWYTRDPLETEEARPVLVQNPEDPDLYRRYLYTLRWVNPHPHLKIKSLTLKGHGSGPTTVVVLAVTLEI